MKSHKNIVSYSMKEEKSKEFVVYKITNVDTGKSYIGITGEYKKRMQVHFNSHNTNSYLHRAINKYGKEKFTHEIIFECNSWDELCKEEIKYIDVLNTKIPNGYNMTDGGEGTLNPSNEIRKKLSIAQKGFSKKQITEIKQMLLNGIPQYKIAQKFNVVQSTIGCIKRNKYYSDIKYDNIKFNDLPKSNRGFINNQILEIRKMLSEKIFVKIIAKQFNVSHATISRIKQNKSYKEIQLPGVILNNLSKGNRKFINNQILEIRKMLSLSISQCKIANKFDVNRITISRIKRNKTYSEIQLPEKEK